MAQLKSLKRCKVICFKENVKIVKGFGVKNLDHLIHQACHAFNLQVHGSKIVLEDETEVDDDEYFALLPDDILFILVPPKQQKSFRFWDVAENLVQKLWRLPTPPLDELLSVIEKLINDDKIKQQIQELLDRSAMNLSDAKTNDPEWFRDLKTNIISKEVWMTKNAKERVRGYYIKSKDDVEKLLFRSPHLKNRRSSNLRLTFERVFESIRNELNEKKFYGGYFGRSDLCLRLCDEHGWFSCQGQFDLSKCKYIHRINPYGSRESRIIFSTWNLDHVVERSRSIVPALAEAIQKEVELTGNQRVNCDYFHGLLFVAHRNGNDDDDVGDDESRANLKFVHAVCHVKSTHHHFRCDSRKYF